MWKLVPFISIFLIAVPMDPLVRRILGSSRFAAAQRRQRGNGLDKKHQAPVFGLPLFKRTHTDGHSHASHSACPEHAWRCSRGGQRCSSSSLISSLWFLKAPVRSQAPVVPLINIRYDPVGRLYHLNRVPTKQLPLVLDELAPEAPVGPDDGAAGFDPGVGLGQRHAVILHEVRQTQRGRAAHPRRAVHQHRAALSAHTVDLISHDVEVQGEWGVGHVCQRDLDILHVRPVEVGKLDGGVDHTGDALGQQQAAVGCYVPSAEEEVGGDLGNGPQQGAVPGNQPRHHGGHHGAMVVVVVVVVEETLAVGTHRGME